MKKIFLIIKLLTLLTFMATPIVATSIHQDKPTFDRVYRTKKIDDSYHFLLLASNGYYYHVHTNRTTSLTAGEIKSPSIIDILKKKRSWGEQFVSKGKYSYKKGKIYTEVVVNRIKSESSKKIKYLNKVFYLQ